MSLFPSAKKAAFAASAFKAAGLDFEKLFAAGDENAISAHVSAAVSAAKPNAELEASLNEAASANNALTSENLKLKEAATKHAEAATQLSTITAALTASGFSAADLADTAKFTAALEAHVKKQAVVQVAKTHGTNPVEQEIAASATEPAKGNDGKELTGIARTIAAFKAAKKAA